jgi:4,5-DOPA dioxygenase extradiol
MVADVIVNADDRAASNNLGNRGWRVKRPSDGKLRCRLVVRSREPIARLIENRLLIAVIMNNSRPCRKGIVSQCVCHRAIAGMTETRDYRNRFPVLFVGHGTPLNAISDNIFTQTWARLGQTIRPRAILSISAHWYTRGTRVTAVERPPTIYDFGYRNLRHLSYPAELLQPAAVVNDEQWGFDHGLKAYPVANIPVVQLSIDAMESTRFHFDLGRRLKPLRDEGVFIVASGNIVHSLNLSIRSGPEIPYPWAERFDTTVRDKLLGRNWNDLIEYQTLDQDWAYAVPTPDHYLPLLYALGAADELEPLSFPVEGIVSGSMSMRSVLFGTNGLKLSTAQCEEATRGDCNDAQLSRRLRQRAESGGSVGRLPP